MTRNAERYLIRKLWSLEVGAFRRHLLRLDPETRQFRFGTAVNDNFLHAYADTARRTGTVIYGAFLGSELCASAELRALHVMGDELAEAAFVVETAHRHQGLGSALMNRIITAAQNRGIHQLHMICARENHPMQQLGRKFGANFTPGEGRGAGRTRDQPRHRLLALGRGHARHYRFRDRRPQLVESQLTAGRALLPGAVQSPAGLSRVAAAGTQA